MANATRRSFVERLQSPIDSPPEHDGSELAAAEANIAAKPTGPPPASSSGAAARHDSSGAQEVLDRNCFCRLLST